MTNKCIIDKLTTDIETCPYCKDAHIIKFGKYKSIQRYRCNCCKKTFSENTNTVNYRSRKNLEIWRKYINLMLDCKSIRDIAFKLEISTVTAFYWRHKLLKSMQSLASEKTLKKSVSMVKYMAKESFKGQRNVRQNEERKKIWVICSADSNKGAIVAPICKHLWDRNKFNELIYNKVDKNAHMETKGDRYLYAIQNEHNKYSKGKANDLSATLASRALNIIKYLRKRMRGVASKYLKQYSALVKIHSINGNKINKEIKSYLLRNKAYVINCKIKEIDFI